MIFVDALNRVKAGTTKVNTITLVKHQYLLLAVSTILAAVLRFYKLGDWSLWGDEAITIGRAQNIFEYSVYRWSVSRLLTYLSLAVFGISEWSARLVPTMVGVISIPVLYFPIRKIFGVSVALLSACLLSISPWHLYWSQNARFYSLLLLFYSLALFMFYYWMEEDRPWYLVAFLLLFGLAIYERLIALALLPVVCLYMILLVLLPFDRPPGLRWRNVGPLSVAGLGLAVVFALPHLQNPSEWFVNFGRVNNNPFWILSGVFYYTRLPIVCMAAVGALHLLQQGRDRAALLLSLNAIVPLSAVMLISTFHYASNRYIFVSLVSFIVLASVAAVHLFRYTRQKGYLLVAGIFLVLLLDPIGEDILYYKYQNGNRDDWSSAFAYVQEHRQPGDRIVARQRAVAQYYLGKQVMPVQRIELQEIEKQDGRIWFIEDMMLVELFPQIHEWLAANAQLVSVLDVHANARTYTLRIYLYDPDG